jgi:hypothetical protein
MTRSLDQATLVLHPLGPRMESCPNHGTERNHGERRSETALSTSDEHAAPYRRDLEGRKPLVRELWHRGDLRSSTMGKVGAGLHRRAVFPGREVRTAGYSSRLMDANLAELGALR